MILTVSGPKSLAEYVKCRAEVSVVRPRNCPVCGGGRMWRHTGYERKARELGGCKEPVWIERFRCATCGNPVSCLFEFLIPYVQYTLQAVAAWVAVYLEMFTTYEELGWIGAGDEKGAVFRKVNLFSRRSDELIDEVQTEAVLSRSETVRVERPQVECKNSVKARTLSKKLALNSSATLLAQCKRLMREAELSGRGVLEKLHGYFMTSSESLRSILSGRNRLRLSNQHSLQRAIF